MRFAANFERQTAFYSSRIIQNPPKIATSETSSQQTASSSGESSELSVPERWTPDCSRRVLGPTSVSNGNTNPSGRCWRRQDDPNRGVLSRRCSAKRPLSFRGSNYACDFLPDRLADLVERIECLLEPINDQSSHCAVALDNPSFDPVDPRRGITVEILDHGAE